MRRRWNLNKIILFAIALMLCASTVHAAGGTVYITKSGSKYHKANCSYLESKIAIEMSDAIAQGYTPCSRCKPGTCTTTTTKPTQSTTPNPTQSTTSQPTQSTTPKPTDPVEQETNVTSGSGTAAELKPIYKSYVSVPATPETNPTTTQSKITASEISNTNPAYVDEQKYEEFQKTICGIVAFVFLIIILAIIFGKIEAENREKEAESKEKHNTQAAIETTPVLEITDGTVQGQKCLQAAEPSVPSTKQIISARVYCLFDQLHNQYGITVDDIIAMLFEISEGNPVDKDVASVARKFLDDFFWELLYSE